MWQLQILPLLRKYWLQITIVIALIAVGVYAGKRLYSPAPPVIQTYHPAEVLPSGALVAEVKPDATATPTMPLRKGDVLTRKVSVTLRSKTPVLDLSGSVTIETKVQQLADMVKQSAPPEMVEQAKQEVIAACVQQECPSTTVNIDLITDQEGQQRAVVSSPDGEVISALDIPKANVVAVKELNYGLGASYDPWKGTAGIIVEKRLHNILPITIGAEVHQTESGKVDKLGARVFGMWNF